MTTIILLKYNNSLGKELLSLKNLILSYPSINLINSPFLPSTLTIRFISVENTKLYLHDLELSLLIIKNFSPFSSEINTVDCYYPYAVY